MQSFHSPVTYTLFDPNVFLCALFSNTLSLCSSNNVRDHITHILWVKRVRRDCRIGRGRTQPIHRTQELGHGYGLTAWTFVCLLVERHITQLHNVRFFFFVAQADSTDDCCSLRFFQGHSYRTVLVCTPTPRSSIKQWNLRP
jgi:hypothetical protein